MRPAPCRSGAHLVIRTFPIARVCCATLPSCLINALAPRNAACRSAEENRKRIGAEVERAKARADAEARDASAAAEARIVSLRTSAKDRLAKAAEEAAIDIVSRLTGDSVSPQEAAAAVRSATGS